VQPAAFMVSSRLESGALMRVLPDYTCVDPAGEDPGFWLIQPDRRLPYRVKLFANHSLIARTHLPRCRTSVSAQMWLTP
jgi:hypothetical protein